MARFLPVLPFVIVCCLWNRELLVTLFLALRQLVAAMVICTPSLCGLRRASENVAVLLAVLLNRKDLLFIAICL